MNYRCLVVPIALALFGCASSGAVERVNRDTFVVRSHALGGFDSVESLREKNFGLAKAWCDDRSEALTIVEDRPLPGVAPQDTITFRCGGRPAGKPAGAPG